MSLNQWRGWAQRMGVIWKARHCMGVQGAGRPGLRLRACIQKSDVGRRRMFPPAGHGRAWSCSAYRRPHASKRSGVFGALDVCGCFCLTPLQRATAPPCGGGEAGWPLHSGGFPGRR